MKGIRNMLMTAAIVLLGVSTGWADGQPNVLFFAVDDMCDWIGPMGYGQAVTPNKRLLRTPNATAEPDGCFAAWCLCVRFSSN